jgi:hypothetical protein
VPGGDRVGHRAVAAARHRVTGRTARQAALSTASTAAGQADLNVLAGVTATA